MAKITLTPQANVLRTLLAAQGKTLNDVAGALQMSPATLRKINSGKPVKDATLQKVADHLRTPVSHFIADDKPISHTEGSKLQVESRYESGLTSATILLKRMTGDELGALARSRTPIDWRLKVSNLKPETAALLRTIEALLMDAQGENTDDFCLWLPDGSFQGKRLSNLIERVEKAQTFEEHLKKLAEQGITVLGASYLYWSRETKEEYWGHGSRTVEDYSCEDRRVIAIVDINVSTLREYILIGQTPPKSATENGHLILVNGGTLEGEFDPENDGIPF